MAPISNTQIIRRFTSEFITRGGDEAWRLVENVEVLVFENDHAFEELGFFLGEGRHIAFWGVGWPAVKGQWRHADFLLDHKP